MKRFLVVLIVMTAAIAHGQYVIGSDTTTARDGVTTMGEAEMQVIPDRVDIAVGVETRDVDLQHARAANDEAINAIIDAAKKRGVDATHIKTDFVSIEPEYYEDSTKPRVYFVRKSLVITSADIGSFETLFPALVGAGANHVHRVRFYTSELRRYRDEARSLAIKAAREKAELLVKDLGRSLGPARAIAESPEDWWSSYGSWWGWGGGGSMTQNVVQVAAGSAPADSSGIAPGRIAVRARVTVIFDLR
jgi:uncharacterized protein